MKFFNIFKNRANVLLFVFLAGCAGMSRSCASCKAENFGADWIVVQYKYDGVPMNCWRLADVSITNETSSDGIYWKDTRTGHLVHISGWYNRVQVFGANYRDAAVLLGIDLDQCDNGAYPSRGK